MAKKITSLDEIIGHRNIIAYLKKRIEGDYVPDVVILYGNPGLGKSSIAKLLAIEVASMDEPASVKEEYIQQVIMNNSSVDSIKLFNMSEIQEREEEIQKVKAELTLGFSKTGRKVLILDEAHNMTKKAQDAILTDLEHLDRGVYVFICTTEIGALRDALISRCKAPLRLNDLNQAECKQLVKSEILNRNLRFNISIEMAIAYIVEYAGNQPRKALNLIENFKPGSLVTDEELSIFFDTNGAAQAVELVKYLYGSLTLGLDYIESLKFDMVFVYMLTEVAKVALGHESSSIGRTDTLYIRRFMADKDTMNLLKFVAEVSGLSTLIKRRIRAAFIRSHISYKSGALPEKDREQHKLKDMDTFMQNAVERTASVTVDSELKVPRLRDMFDAMSTVK